MKDCQPQVAGNARTGARDYKGYMLVEQGILPGMGTPRESALRSEYLRSVEKYIA